VEREHRITSALDGTAVPHAAPLLLCTDDAVIGVPFVVMEWVSGVRLYDAIPATLDSPEGRVRIGEELFDALAELHEVPWRDVGLEGLGNPDTFTQRQVGRWMSLYERVRTRELPALVEAAKLLDAQVPAMQRAALIHGDYGLHNVLYAQDAPVRLEAVLDWETATIGDPLLDLGYLLGLWLEGDEPDRWFSTALPYAIDGFPARDEMAARYAARTGLDLSDIQWYRAVAQLKVACILEGAYARHVDGGSDNPGLARLEQVVPNHAEYALAIARGDA
jgi:aminoglycoside phosphotransferase (APT) family kinase protein